MDDPNITMEEYIRISFKESDDEDYTIVFDKNSFSYKLVSTNHLKTDLENDNEKVNMPLFLTPEPLVSCIDDLDFFKDFDNEFPAIVYNDALTSKSDFLTEPTLCPQHIDKFNLKDETSLSECDEEEENVLYFNDLFPSNVIYSDDSKSNKDNDDDKIDIKHSSRDLSIEPLPNVSILRILGFGVNVVEDSKEIYAKGLLLLVEDLMLLARNVLSWKENEKKHHAASALDNDTTFCFLLLYVTRLPPTKEKYPDVDRLFPLSPAQKYQFDVLSYKTGIEHVEARLVVYQQNENVFKEDIKLLKLDIMLRDNALVELRKKFEKAKQERDDSESDVSIPTSPVYNRYKSGEGYHVVPPPYTGTFMPSKLALVFHDAPTASEIALTILNVEPKDESKGEPMPTQKVPSFVQPFEHVKTLRPFVKPDYDYHEKKMVQKPISNHAMRGNHQQYARMTHPYPHMYVVPIAVLTRSMLVPLTAARPVTTTGNSQHALKDKGVIDSGYSRHMTGNISYLSDFEEISRGYVAFGGNPKGGKIICKGKIRTGSQENIICTEKPLLKDPVGKDVDVHTYRSMIGSLSQKDF
nr:hypothetical protein [Tanacetum cinerariifolium]